MKKPSIGIVFAPGKDNKRILKIETQYLSAVEKSGGVPYLIPVYRQGLKPDPGIVGKFDAFVFSGSVILENRRDELPSVYRNLPSKLKDVNPLYYDFCSSLLGLIKQSNKPLLGICRGMQLIAEAEGGEVSVFEQTIVDHYQTGKPWISSHDVKLEKNNRLFRYVSNLNKVNSFHRQRVIKMPLGYKVTATAIDGTTEAFESENDKLIMGIQFHPEWIKNGNNRMLPVFKSFIQDTKAFA